MCQRLRAQIIRQRAPRVPYIGHEPGQQRDHGQHGEQAAQAHVAQILPERHADRAAHQERGRIADQREQTGGVADQSRQDHGPGEVHVQRDRNPDDDRRHENHCGCVRQERADRGHQRDQQQEETLAAAAGSAQEPNAHMLENAGGNQSARHHHAAEQQRQHPFGRPGRIEDVFLRQDAQRHQDAGAEQHRDGHVDHIEGDRQNHSGEHGQRDDGLELAHR